MNSLILNNPVFGERSLTAASPIAVNVGVLETRISGIQKMQNI